MIDTIALHQAGENGQDFDLKTSKLIKQIDEQELQVKYFKVFYDGKKTEKRSPIYVGYSPNKQALRLQFSVPKLLQGNSLENYKLSEISDIHLILEKRLQGILSADFNNMKISRLDVAKNMNVENDVGLYLQACDNARAVNKRYANYKFSNETVTFANSSRRITLYDKIKETLSLDRTDELARQYKKSGRNILRFEIQHKSGKSISTHLKELSRDLSIETIYRNSNKFIDEFSNYLKNEFQKFFFYSRQYEMFIENTGLIYAINDIFGKRNLAINTLAKKYMQEHQEFKSYDFALLFTPYYSERNIVKIRKQLDKLQKLGNLTKIDLIAEIETKLVA